MSHNSGFTTFFSCEQKVFIMAYYLKKMKLKGRTYLSIDESFYSHEKKGTAHINLRFSGINTRLRTFSTL